MANDLSLKIRIEGEAKSGIDAFRALKSSVVDTSDKLNQATAKIKELVAAANTGKLKLLEDAQKEADGAAKKLENAQRELEFFRRSAEIGGAVGIKEFGKDIEKAKSAITKASAELEAHNAKIEKIKSTSATAIPEYARQLDAAKKAARGLKDESEGQAVALEKARRALSAQGVDVTKLASEQVRLNKAQADSTQRMAEWARQAAAGGVANARISDSLAALSAQSKKVAEMDSARAIVGVRSHAQIRAEIDKVAAAYQRLKASGSLSQSELAQAAGRAKVKMDELRQSMSSTSSTSGTLGGSIATLRGAFAAVGAALASSKILQYADEMTLLRGRLMLVEGSQTGVNRAMGEIARIATATGTDINAVGSSYFRFASAIQKVGGSSEQAVRFTEAVAKSLKLSGASAAEAGSTMQQLGQALMKGSLNGDEFRAVAENGGLVLDYLAKSLGKTRGEMMAMSSEGKLTTKEMMRLGDSLTQIDKDFQNVPQTVGAGVTNIVNKFKEWADISSLVKAASNSLIAVMKLLADNFSAVANVAAGLTFAAAAASIAGLVARFGPLIAVAGRFVIGMTPVGRAIMIVVTLLGALSDGIAKVWRVASESRGAAILVDVFSDVSDAIVSAWNAAKDFIAWILRVMKAVDDFYNRFGSNSAAKNAAATLNPFFLALQKLGPTLASAGKSIGDFWSMLISPTAINGAVRSLDDLTGAVKVAAQQIKGSLADGIALATERAKTMGEAYKQAAETIKQAMADKLAAVQRSLEAERQAIAASGNLSEAQRIEAETNAYRGAAAQRIAIIRDVSAQQIAAAEGTYSRLEGLARTAGQSVNAVEQDSLRVKQDIYRQTADVYRATVDQLIAEENRLMGEVRSLNAERVRMKMSTEDQLRDLARSAMNEAQAFGDRQLQVDQKQSAARQALAKGDFTIAKQLAEEAQRLAAQNAREVKIPGADGKMQVVVTQAQAVARAMGEIRESSALADAAVANKATARQAQIEGLAGATDKVKTALAEVESALDAVKTKAEDGATIKLKAEFAEADAIVAKFKDQVANEKFLANIQANLEKAQADINAWRADPDNTALKMQAGLALDGALKDMDTLEAEAKRRKIPLNFDFATARNNFGNLKYEMEKGTASTHTVSPETRQAQDAINALKADTSSTHTVYVRQVEQRATGGLIGAVQHLATGGRVFRRQIGRIFGPGTGTSDSVPVMASAGEFMVRAAAVRKYGVNFLDNLNRGIVPIEPISRALAPAVATSPAAASAMQITINGPRGETVRVTSERDEAQRLVRLLRNAGVSLA